MAAVADATVAGATGTPTAFTIKVNGANTNAATTSPTSTIVASGLPSGATGTVEFDQGSGPL